MVWVGSYYRALGWVYTSIGKQEDDKAAVVPTHDFLVKMWGTEDHRKLRDKLVSNAYREPDSLTIHFAAGCGIGYFTTWNLPEPAPSY